MGMISASQRWATCTAISSKPAVSSVNSTASSIVLSTFTQKSFQGSGPLTLSTSDSNDSHVLLRIPSVYLLGLAASTICHRTTPSCSSGLIGEYASSSPAPKPCAIDVPEQNRKCTEFLSSIYEISYEGCYADRCRETQIQSETKARKYRNIRSAMRRTSIVDR